MLLDHLISFALILYTPLSLNKKKFTCSCVNEGFGSRLSIDFGRGPYGRRRCRFSFLWGCFVFLFGVTYSASGSGTAGKRSIHDRSLPTTSSSSITCVYLLYLKQALKNDRILFELYRLGKSRRAVKRASSEFRVFAFQV